MRRTMLVMLLAVVLATFLGCRMPESQRLELAGDDYATTVGLLADARQAGLITDQEAWNVEIYRPTAWANLQAWRDAFTRKRAAEDQGEPVPPPTWPFEAATHAAMIELKRIAGVVLVK